jgi:hypothetical protein
VSVRDGRIDAGLGLVCDARLPSTSPAVYCPRTASASESGARTALSTSTLWSRSISASHSAGGSIVANVIICTRWFWIMSRSAPIRRSSGNDLDAERLGHGDLDLVDVSGAQHGLDEPVREPEHEMFCTGLLAEEVVDAEDLVSRQPCGAARSARARS